MNNSDNSTFSPASSNASSPTPNNNSRIPMSLNNSNGSASTAGESSGSNNSGNSSVSDFIVLPLLSITIILAVAYTILVLVRPTFRVNKLNWFTINVCLTSTLLSSIMFAMTTIKVVNGTNVLPCRVQGFLQAMAACQMMYSHAVIAVSRFLTVVYSNKRIFRSTGCIWSFIGFGWLIAFLVALPYLVVNNFACTGSTGVNFLPYYTLTAILIIPVMIVLICNIRIFLFVHQSSRRVHAESTGNNASQTRDVRLIKTMIITFAVFVVGWSPLFVEQTFSESIKISSTADTVFQILPPLSMLYDVILLIYTNQPVRLFLWQLIVRQRQVIPTNTLANGANTKAHIINNY